MRKLGLALTVLFLLVAAAGTYLALRPSEETAPSVELRDGSEADGPSSVAPSLLAAGRRAGGPEAPNGAYTIPGRVVDPVGAPAAGVRVTATRTGPAYDPEDPARWTPTYGAAAARKRFDALTTPVVGEPKADGETVSDAEGRFSVTVKEPGSYQMRAIPSAPRVGSAASATVLARRSADPVWLRVGPGVVLAGRVVDAGDRPVAGAAVGGAWRTKEGLASTSVFAVETAPDGTFRWDAVPEGTCSASVTVPERGTYSGFETPSPRADPWVLRLPPVSAIRGRVTDSGGAGIADVDLVVSLRRPAAPSAQGSSELKGRSGRDGAYRIEGAPAGVVGSVWLLPSDAHLAEVQAPPLATWSGAEVKAGEDLALDLVLSKGAAVEVTVVGEDGVPLEGAEVTALGAATGARSAARPAPSKATDREGHARIDGLALGRYVLHVRHATHYLRELEQAPRGYEMTPEGFPITPGPPASLLIVLAKEGDVARKTLRLTRGLAVTGRVTGPDGAPVSEARVSRAGAEGGQAIWQWGVAWDGAIAAGVPTDAEGRFRLDALPPTEALVLVAKKAPLVGTQSEPVRLAAGTPPPEVSLVMAVGASLSGTVLDAEGKAALGVSIAWWGGDGVTWSNGNGTCDEAGAFRLDGLPTGTLSLTVSTVAGLSKQAPVTPPLKAGEQRAGFVVRLGRPARVSGTTVDADGAPVSGVQVHAASTADGTSQGHAVSQSDGTFVIPAMPEGPLTIQATEVGEDGMGIPSANSAVSARAPAEGVKLVVARRPRTRVLARIVGPDGAPIPLCTVGPASPMGNEVRYPGAGGGEDVVGGLLRREFPRARPIHLTVRGARDADGVPMNLRPKTFSVTTDAEIEVRLDVGREIVGLVVDPDGRGVPGVTVSGGGCADDSAADGTFRLRGLAPDLEVTLAAQVPSGWIRPEPRRLRATETSVTLALTRGLAIAGKVIGSDGEPCTQCFLQVQSGATMQSAQVGAGGRFRIEGLSPGAVVDLMAMAWNVNGGGQRSTVVKAVRAGTEDLIVRFERGVDIEGLVVDAQGQPATQGWVMAQPLADEGGPAGGANGVIRSDGHFTIEGLRPGPYQLSAQADGSANATLRVDAPARDVRLVLPLRVKLTGRLLGSGDRSGFRVNAYTSLPGAPAVRASQRVGGGRTDADGAFTFDVTGEGPFELFAWKNEDDRWARVTDVRLGGPNPTLTLEVGLTVEGVLEAADGGPLPDGVWVIASAKDGRFSQRVTPGANGAFRVRGLPPGTYMLMCGREGAASATPVEVEAGSAGHRLKLPEK